MKSLNIPWDRDEMRQEQNGTTGQPLYQGFAAPGTPTNSERWTLYKYTYSGNFITLRQVAFKKAWDSRAASF